MKQIFLIALSSLFLLNCNNDDEGSGNPSSQNEMTYLDETHPIDLVQVYYYENDLIIQGGTADENYGFGASFRDSQMENLDGTYHLNLDENTYDPETDFNAGAIYYLDDATFIQEGEITVHIDEENEKINLEFDFVWQGEHMTGNYEGSYE